MVALDRAATDRGPLTLREEVICAAFAEVLGAARVGAEDNFFELGGNSLLAVSLAERLRACGLPVAVRQLFLTPTPAALATADAAGQVTVPPRAIPDGATRITPDMLPLVRLTQEQADAIAAQIPGGAANVADVYPLAPLQEGMFFHHLMSTDSDAYLLPTVLRFDSRARLDEFLGALQRVIDRHDIFRTSLAWEGLPEPVQVVWRHAPLPVTEVTPEAADGDDLTGRLIAAVGLRLDLSRAPLLDVHVATEPGTGLPVALLRLHHLAVDHTAQDVLLAEVRAMLAGTADRLPEPLPFRDFVAQARLGIPREEHERYFAELLGDVTEPTAAFGLTDVHGDGTAADFVRLPVQAALATRLRDAARALGVSPATIWHLAWARVLAAASGRDDVVFGTVLFGRMNSGAGADRVPGPFINTLPVRVTADQFDAGVGTALLAIQAQLAGLLAHEHAPLALAQQASGVARPAPLFATCLNYRYSPAEQGTGRGMPGIEVRYGRDRTNYPVFVSVDDSGAGFFVSVEAAVAVGAERVRQLVITAAEGLVEALEGPSAIPLWRIGVLTGPARRQVLDQWNDTAMPVPAATLTSLAQARTAQSPDAVAVVCAGAAVTYAELNAAANRLARLLAGRGIGPESVVAVLMDRSADLVLALLAVLKAGAAYLPLDAGLPPARVTALLADAGAACLLATSKHAARVTSPVPVIAVDDPRQREAVAGQPGTDLTGDDRTAPLLAAHPAYVIYTSGSTGVPKGVVITHANLVNYLAWCARRYPALGGRGLAPTAISFDATVTGLYGTLLAGGCLCLDAVGGPGIAGLGQLSFLKVTPGHLPLLSALPPSGAAGGQLVIGGEQLSGPALGQWRQRHPQFEIINEYGPAEATVGCVAAQVGPDDPLPEGVVPIGRPAWNARAFVLDRWLEPVPPGAAGELYLAGAGLARGYAGRPDLTGERFVACPFGVPGERMYRTGDLARWTVGGELEFLGRTDDQVKIREFRVEPGEVASTLAAHPDVAQAVVTAHGAGQGGSRLVGYVVPAGAAGEGLAAAVRAFAAARLPGYMVPAAVMVLDALPLTAHGKLDRAALPAPRVPSGGRGRSVVALDRAATDRGPLTLREEVICAAFAEVLGAARVGAEDNFFELGGNSLLAVRLVQRLRASGLPVAVRQLFLTPTPAALATADDASQVTVPPTAIPDGAARITPEMLPLVQLTQEQADAVVAGVPGGAANVADVYPLAPLQEGIFFHHLMAGPDGTDAYVLPTMLRFESAERLARFRAALERVMDRHDIFRTSIAWQGLPEPVQVVWRHAELPVAEVAVAPGEPDIAGRLAAAAGPRLDLSRAPLLDVHYAAEPETGHLLALVRMHHLVVDHTALSVVLGEIRAIATGREEQLPHPLPFRDYVAQARVGTPREEHERYFAGLLGDVTEPTAAFGLTDVHGDGAGVTETRVTLPPALAARLRAAARARGVSPATLWHLAWARVLAAVSGRDDVVFGTVLLGRMNAGAGADRVPGPFVNTLPVRVDVGAATVGDAVAAMRAQLAGLLAHEHAPLTLAQRASGVAAPAPLFTTLLNYRHGRSGDEAGGAALAGVTLLSLRDRTNYPLTVSVEDTRAGFGITVLAVTRVHAELVCDLMATAADGLVRALTDAPGSPLWQVPVLSAAQRARLLVGLNNAGPSNASRPAPAWPARRPRRGRRPCRRCYGSGSAPARRRGGGG